MSLLTREKRGKGRGTNSTEADSDPMNGGSSTRKGKVSVESKRKAFSEKARKENWGLGVRECEFWDHGVRRGNLS